MRSIQLGMDSSILEQTSDQFIGQWRLLVSTTNWDKGRIIHDWRKAMIGSDAPTNEYSDDAWSRRVGNVTPQHVGRLRRVYERFGAVRDTYAGLYWSHFQAALDWNDAEMWLEGAVQNDWSISEMRAQRQTALGLEDDGDAVVDAPASDWDPSEELDPDEGGVTLEASVGSVHDPNDGYDEQAAFGASRVGAGTSHETSARGGAYDATNGSTHDDSTAPFATQQAAPHKPFATLPSLPNDVTDAFEAYKLCILRHKLAGWTEVSLDDLIASLEALKEFALVPASED